MHGASSFTIEINPTADETLRVAGSAALPASQDSRALRGRNRDTIAVSMQTAAMTRHACFFHRVVRHAGSPRREAAHAAAPPDRWSISSGTGRSRA
jgi:hypothetical protein